jgi:hypothetical protein
MESSASGAPASKKMIWAGWIISAVPFLLMVLSAVIKWARPPAVVEGFADFGLPLSFAFGLGVLEFCCAVIYVVPQTSVLGAILVTGYMGGAILTNLRVGDSMVEPALMGVLAWLGLYLRDTRLWALIPLRK